MLIGRQHARLLLVLVMSFPFCCGSKLLLILLDGFRWDYFEQDGLSLSGFEQMAMEGVKMEYMIPVYPSLSFPNYYSLMTGVHSENHGQISNHMYDERHGKNLFMAKGDEKFNSFWWNDAEPLWVTAEKMGKKSYFYHWRQCEVAIRGVKPTYCKMYDEITTIPHMQHAINESLILLRTNAADLVGIYIEAVDHYGHQYGVGSLELNDMLLQVDEEVRKLTDTLTSDNKYSDVNLMIFSDHGMTNINTIVNLTKIINLDDVISLIPEGATVKIWPKEGKIQKVYQELIAARESKITVYKKENIPKRYNLKGHYRVAPIFVEADAGVYIVTPCKCVGCLICNIPYANVPKFEKSGDMKGMHGYDNIDSDMRAMFIATGPAFKKNYISKPLVNVELYQIMCSILEIEPQPHNGTWSNVEGMLAQSEQIPSLSNIFLWSIIAATIYLLVKYCK